MCYRIETIIYDDPLFQNVDATYILHLESDGTRYTHIKQQLELYHPTKIVHVVFNKGFRHCHKPHVHNTTEDIIDTFMYIMKESQKYNTILLLEDDFIFNPNIHRHTKNVDEFTTMHTNFIYRLGCIPAIQLPYNLYTYVGIGCGSHAVLLSKSIRKKIMNQSYPTIDWDLYLNKLSANYIYYTPLCYQLFPATENQKNWGVGNVLLIACSQLQIRLFNALNLHVQPEPGYTIMYVFSKIVPLVTLYFLYKTLFIFKNNNSYHKSN